LEKDKWFCFHHASLWHLLSYRGIVGTPSRWVWGSKNQKLAKWIKVIDLCVSFFLLAQANGWACVDFGCTHPIDGLF